MFCSMVSNVSVRVFLANRVTDPENSLKTVESNSKEVVRFIIGLLPGMRVLGSIFVKKLSYKRGVQIFLLEDSFHKGNIVAGKA